MRNNIRSTNLRFNLEKDLQRKAWEYLQTMDKQEFKSYSHVIALALQGRVFMPPIRCKCQQELYEQEETKRKLLEKQAEIERMKASGLQDKALYDYTFDKDNGINPEMAYAHKYVENWEDMKANSSGLLLWGNVGTGKSFFGLILLAASSVNEYANIWVFNPSTRQQTTKCRHITNGGI